MYRGITLSSCVSKLFERVLVEILGEALDSDVLQYGFKKNCSTRHALFSFGESVRYFTSQGSQVYCVSLDASKAFDRVIHSGLFVKLAKRGIPLPFIRMLKYWYSHLQCAVLWKGVLGNVLILHVELDKGVSYRHF